jgi:alkyl hydroperoxide reductase subunit AhpF
LEQKSQYFAEIFAEIISKIITSVPGLLFRQFDVFVIGGGATGAGCALDAATRGLKTAMVNFRFCLCSEAQP